MVISTFEEFVSTEEGMREFQRERAILEVTNLIERTMEQQGITRSALASKLGRSKGWVTQLLDGESNKTIRTVADALAVMGQELRVTCWPIHVGPETHILRIAAGTWADKDSRKWEFPAPAPQIKAG